MLFCLLFAKVVSPKAKKFVKEVRANLTVLNEVLVITVENSGAMLPKGLLSLYTKKYNNPL